MSAANLASLNNNKEANPPAKTGAGQAGITATTTAVVAKGTAVVDQVATAVATHAGSGTTPPEKASNFDRTVATLLGK